VIWKIAWGGIRRHGRRSTLIVLVVAMSVVVMLLVSGMMDGIRDGFFETMVSTGGHLQVDHVDAADALDPFSLELLIADWQAEREWFLAQPEVIRAEPILTFGALVLADGVSVPMVGHGVEQETGFFRDVREGVVDGRFLEDPSEILLSTETAEMLDVAVGAEVSVLVEDSSGAPYYLAYTLAGVFRSESAEFDRSGFLITHAAAQELLYLGDETREIRVALTDETLAPAVADRFAAARGALRSSAADSRAGGAGPGERGNPPPPIGSTPMRVRDWEEINGGTAVLLRMFDVFMYAINLLIVTVAATVITNAILMNVFEKVREYGMMRAIGLTRRGQFRLILAEGTSYGVAGSLLGLLIGVPLVLWFSTRGIYVGEMMDSFGMGREMTTSLDAAGAAINALFGATVAVAGSLYAAIVATRLSVIESVRGTA
jgi:putative ABC transport system permease protein